MSRRYARVLIALMMVFGLVVPGVVSLPDSEAATAVKLSNTSISLQVGKSQTIKVKAAKKVKVKKTTFSSKNKKIATVSKKGKITAKAKGNTKIVAKVTYKKSGKKSTKKLYCKVKATGTKYKYTEYAKMTADEIVAKLTLEQKAAQMLQPACYEFLGGSNAQMKDRCYGSILSKYEPLTADGWKKFVNYYQEAAVTSKAGIPYVYGQDDVHGVNYCSDATIFPHNIGLGAANDENLMYKMGQVTADEAKLCHMLWNFSPCVAQSVDPRWGRTYESYGSDLNIIKKLSKSYVKGMQDNGLIACAKHFFGDGNVMYGTGEGENLIDRGDAQLNDSEIEDLLSVYKELIDAGVQTIMISHSSLNGTKMHEYKEYIEKLKNEYGFEGFIVSDWESVTNIPNKKNYYEQIVAAVNSGIDMLMEIARFEEAADNIVAGVNNGDIAEERVDDAVRRILQVKLDAGIIADPYGEKLTTKYKTTGSKEARSIAEKLVEKSLVLMKNDNDILPLKEGQKIYISGPAAENDSAQCGGWTLEWNDVPEDIDGVTNIREGFEQVAKSHGITIVDDPGDADLVVLCVGEQAYAEWNGDADNLDLCNSPLALEGNKEAIEEAKIIDKPVVACIVAGRNVYVKDYEKDWDGVVMCYLPGSEGQGVAKVLCGEKNFSGKLPSNWYSSNEGFEKNEPWRMAGEGLTY